MNLGEFIQRCRLQIPNTNEIGVDNVYLTTILNQACNEVNKITKSYSGYTDFTIEADKRVYQLSLIVPKYLGTDKRGLFIKDADGNWEDIIPKSEAWLRRVYPDYLNASSVAMPQWYYIETDDLGFHPPMNVASTGRLYHLMEANPMSSDTDYPFSGNTTEITALTPLDDAIVAYARWKLSPAFGQTSDQDLRLREFSGECKKAAIQVNRRKDLTHDSTYGIKI